MTENTVLPLINTAFEPGNARKAAESFEDRDFREIAIAEFYYFTGQAQKCSDQVDIYIMSSRLELKLSACMLYVYSNLTLGNAKASERGLEIIRECLRKEMVAPTSERNTAYCVFAGYAGTVLLHLSTEELPDMKKYMSSLPQGLRIFAASIISHTLYLNGEYSRALGICDAALFSCKEIYPVGMIYLHCVTAMCEISLKNPAEAEKAILTAWKLAVKDELIEPFIELHGLLQGLLESCIRKENPEMYRKISDAVITFSRGWMAVHNPASDRPVTDALTTMEFSIAMLACRDWSNREIAEHMGVSLNTVKHYLTDIFNKLHVKKRDELKNFVLK